MKIAFVGAAGYGNIGDDTYPLVFREHLPEHELVFFNSDLPERLPDDLQLLVLGGGGLIYDSPQLPQHIHYMRFYMDAARGQGIPWGFAACGLQLRPLEDGYDRAALRPWVDYFRAAHFVTLRSRKCVDIVRELSGQCSARYFPDLAYLFDPIGARRQARSKQITLVPAGAAVTGERAVSRLIAPFLSVGYKLVVMGMGANCDDQIHLDRARNDYPQATFVRPRDPREALLTIAQSSFVISGRYHGLVFARTAGVPFWFPEDGPYKVREEDLSNDPREAIGHIRVLQEVIQAAA